MSERYDLVSVVEATTTDVRGRFHVEGPGYGFFADSSLRAGGPGEEIGILDLLVSSLVVCALNVLRKENPNDHREDSAEISCVARVRRPHEGGAHLGTLTLEVEAESVSRESARIRVDNYRRHCRVYKAIRANLDVRFIVHHATGTEHFELKNRPSSVGRRPARPKLDPSILARAMDCY